MLNDIWKSFMDLPVWVRIWVAVFLIPTNLVPLAFMDHPQGGVIAVLALLGMALNLPIMILERGFSKAMALPHLLCWVPMVAIVVTVLVSRAELSSEYVQVLMLLLVVDLISLGFDINDAFVWFRHRRQ